jgi:hypothetical protein
LFLGSFVVTKSYSGFSSGTPTGVNKNDPNRGSYGTGSSNINRNSNSIIGGNNSANGYGITNSNIYA